MRTAETQLRPTNVRWLVFALAAGASFLLYLHRYTWAILKTLVGEEFGWSNETLGWLDSAFMFSYAFGQIPGGMLGDWFGPRTVLSAMIVVWSLAMGGMGLARGALPMAWVRGLFGLAQAGCYPNLNKVTKVWFPVVERTTVQGWISASGRLGGAAAFLIVGSFLLGVWALPWRTVLLWMAGTGAAYGALVLLLFRNTPRQHPWSNAAEAHLVVASDPSAARAARSVMNWRLVLRHRVVWALLFQQITCAFVDNFFSNWLPLFLKDVKRLELSSGGWMSALPLLSGAAGGVLAGGFLQSWLLRTFDNRRWARSLIGLTGNLLAGACLFASLQFDDAGTVVAWFCALKFFADWAQPACWAVTTDMGGRCSASLFALVNMSGSLAAFAAGPIMGKTIDVFGNGVAGDARGWTVLLAGIGFVYLASALSWLLIDCTQPVDPGDGSVSNAGTAR